MASSLPSGNSRETVYTSEEGKQKVTGTLKSRDASLPKVPVLKTKSEESLIS
jgi:hypothetical protein